MESVLDKIYISGVGITTAREEKILELLSTELKKPRKSRNKIVIFTPNPEQIARAGDPKIRNLLNQAQIALPDGSGIVAASRLLGEPIYARITGVDFMEKLVNLVSNQPVNTGYLGAQRGVAEKASECLREKHPNLRVVYASHTYDAQKMIGSDIDILFVAMGFPKQEEWIIEHKDEIPAAVFMAVGGSFDFIAGIVPRAPRIMQRFYLEWLFRLIVQPWRFKRQLQIWRFGALILQEALSNRLKRVKK